MQKRHTRMLAVMCTFLDLNVYFKTGRKASQQANSDGKPCCYNDLLDWLPEHCGTHPTYQGCHSTMGDSRREFN